MPTTTPEHWLITQAKTAPRPKIISLTDYVRCSFIGLAKSIASHGTMDDLKGLSDAFDEALKIAQQSDEEAA